MKEPQRVYVCTECDAQSPRWTGQCLECGAWGVLKETRLRKPGASGGAAGSGDGRIISAADAVDTTAFEDIPSTAEKRMAIGMAEADRVFGGGIVDGSVVLLGGEPGIGKSTLSLMICSRLAAQGRQVLYMSGEESPSQVKLRADRLGLPQKGMRFVAVTDVDKLVATLEKEKPGFAVVDSVQMLRSDDIPSEAGATGQVRGAAGRLVAWAKSSGTPVLLIGHVTKDGTVAGPKTLEHVVDAVLSFEGERTHPLRVLRTLKNRFGSTDETGIFEMTEMGLTEIRNPSAYLLEARSADTAGSAVTCIIEGTRPILVEIQALVQKTSFGYPARKATGFDGARLEMLIAVLGKRGRIDLSSYDVYLNVAGGMRIKEPAADLAVLLALASAWRDTPLPAGLAAWGEVGLGGELRPVPAGDRRVAEAAALGVSRALVPARRQAAAPGVSKKPTGISVTAAATVGDALGAAFAASSGAGASERPVKKIAASA